MTYAPAYAGVTGCTYGLWGEAMFGKALIALGILLVAAGVVFIYAPWLVNWFGRLPGDIRIERDGGSVFIPITSMIVVSVVVSLVLNIFFRQ